MYELLYRVLFLKSYFFCIEKNEIVPIPIFQECIEMSFPSSFLLYCLVNISRNTVRILRVTGVTVFLHILTSARRVRDAEDGVQQRLLTALTDPYLVF